MQINNPTTFSTPDLTLTTSNSSGSAGALRADDSILVYDTTLPDAITFGQSGSAGDTATAARRNHSHAMASETAVPVATQAQMEAASSTAVFVTPGRNQYHPGVAKAWGKINQAGSQSMIVSYNVSSVADAGTGLSTVSFDTDFSGTGFVTVGSRENGVITFNSPAAGSVRVDSRDYSGTEEDSGEVYFAAFGDQ